MPHRDAKPAGRKKLIGSLAAALIGGGLLYYLPSLLTTAVKSQMKLREGVEDQIYEQWTKFPIPVRYSFFFFHIENPREALRGAKPRVREVGPFCFDQWRTKKVLGWGENGETVKYLEYKNHIFVPDDGSCKSNLDMKITTINPPIAALGATIAEMVKEKVPLAGVTSPVIYSSISALLAAHSQNLFMTRTVRDILYGFRINLLDTVTTLIKPLEMLGFKDLLPGGGIPNNTFGLLYGKNNTPEGPYEVYTGINNKPYINLIKWKNMRNLKFWDAEFCNQIKGTDGSLFGPGIQRTDKLWAFAADLCRSLYLVYERDSEFQGIPTYRFGIGKKLFGSPALVPENECFCIHQKRRDRCSINGIYDLGGCQFGAPILMSAPHFYNTDPDLSEQIDGLNPNKKDHASFVEVEPITGAGVSGNKALQFAFRVESVPFLRGFDRVRNVTIPFAWARESADLPENMADELKMMLFTPVKYTKYVLAIVGTGGAVMFVYLGAKRLFGGGGGGEGGGGRMRKESLREYAQRKLSHNRLYRRGRGRVADSAEVSSNGSRATSETVLVEQTLPRSIRRKQHSLHPIDSQLMVRRFSGSRFIQPYVLGQSNLMAPPSMLSQPMYSPQTPSFPILAIQYPFPMANGQQHQHQQQQQQQTNGSIHSIHSSSSPHLNYPMTSASLRTFQMTNPEAGALRASQVTIHQLQSRPTSSKSRSRTSSIPPPPPPPPPIFSLPPIPLQSIQVPVDHFVDDHHSNGHHNDENDGDNVAQRHRPSVQWQQLSRPSIQSQIVRHDGSSRRSTKEELPHVSTTNNSKETQETNQKEDQDGMELLHTYFYGDGGLSDEDHGTMDDLNEQVLEEDRRRLKQLGLE